MSTPVLVPGFQRLDHGQRYQLERCLSAVESRRVWLARDRVLECWVVLKGVLAVPGDPKVLEVVGELERLRRFAHPRLAGVLDLSSMTPCAKLESELTFHFFSQEWLPGPSFHALAAARSLSGPALTSAIRGLLEAVAFLHDGRLVRLDLKSAHLLHCARGWCLIDLDQARSENPLEHRELAGTLPFLAPELLRGEGGSVATDLYSVGAILFHGLSGTLPPLPKAQLGPALARAVQSSEIPELPAACWTQVAGLAQLCQSLLERDPARRPGSAAAALAALNAADSEWSTRADRAPVQRLPMPPLSGRTAQLKALDHWLESLLKAGEDACGNPGETRSRLIRLEGPAGSGFSRLLAELKLRWQQRGLPTLLISPRKLEGSGPHGLELIERHVCSVAGLPYAGSSEAIAANCGTTPGKLEESAMEVLARLLEAARVILDAQSPRCVPILIDDLEDLEPDVSQGLEWMLSYLPAGPLCVVLACPGSGLREAGAPKNTEPGPQPRGELPSDMIPSVSGALGKLSAIQVRLPALRGIDARAIVDSLFDAGTIDGPALEALLERCGGLPAHLMEALAGVKAEGLSFGESYVPSRLEIQVAQQLQRWSLELRKLALAACIPLQSFTLPLLSTLCGRSLDPSALEPLLLLGWLHAEVRPDEALRYTMPNGMLRRSLEVHLDPRQRIQLHQALFRVLQAQETPDPSVRTQVLVHALYGGQLEWAARRLASDEDSGTLLPSAEAIVTALRTALSELPSAAMPTSPEPAPERDALPTRKQDPATRSSHPPGEISGEAPDELPTWVRPQLTAALGALELEIGHPDCAVLALDRALSADPPLDLRARARAYALKGRALSLLERRKDAAAALERALELNEPGANVPLEWRVSWLHQLASAQKALGQNAACSNTLQRARVLPLPLGTRLEVDQLELEGALAMRLGPLEPGFFADLEGALALARSLAYPVGEIKVVNTLVVGYLQQGRLEQACLHQARVVELAHARFDRPREATGRMNYAGLLRQCARGGEALEELRLAEALFLSMGNRKHACKALIDRLELLIEHQALEAARTLQPRLTRLRENEALPVELELGAELIAVRLSMYSDGSCSLLANEALMALQQRAEREGLELLELEVLADRLKLLLAHHEWLSLQPLVLRAEALLGELKAVHCAPMLEQRVRALLRTIAKEQPTLENVTSSVAASAGLEMAAAVPALEEISVHSPKDEGSFTTEFTSAPAQVQNPQGPLGTGPIGPQHPGTSRLETSSVASLVERFSELVSHLDQIEVTASALAHLLGQLLGARCLVLLIQDKHYEVLRAYDAPAAAHDDISRHVFNQVRRTRAPLEVADIYDDEELGQAISLQLMAVRSILCFPVLDRAGELVGMLYAGHPEPGALVGQEQRALMMRAVELARGLLLVLAHRRRRELPSLDDLGLIGSSPAMRRLREEILELIDAELERVFVMLFGETGVGKNLVADLLHKRLTPVNAPLVSCNCASIPAELLETELFGSVRGAYSGATDRQGLLFAARGGTLFLDEVGELSLHHQAKLLTVLNAPYQFRRVGELESRTFAGNLITATNQPIVQRIRDKTFRLDLYQRMCANTLEIPSLRARGREDIHALTEHLLHKTLVQLELREEQAAGLELTRYFSPRALQFMCEYAWPGNVRELEGLFQRARIRSRLRTDGVRRVELEDLEHALKAGLELLCDGPTRRFLVAGPKPGLAYAGLCDWADGIKARYVHERLSEHAGDKKATAAQLGTTRDTVYRLLAKLPESQLDDPLYQD